VHQFRPKGLLGPHNVSGHRQFRHSASSNSAHAFHSSQHPLGGRAHSNPRRGFSFTRKPKFVASGGGGYSRMARHDLSVMPTLKDRMRHNLNGCAQSAQRPGSLQHVGVRTLALPLPRRRRGSWVILHLLSPRGAKQSGLASHQRGQWVVLGVVVANSSGDRSQL
jgi:hypothetical protein